MAKKKSHKKPTIEDVAHVDEHIAKLQIVKSLAINDALHSTDVDSIYKAQQYLKQIEKKDENVKPQSLLFDPQQFGADGYKTKSFKLSYEMLRAMGNIPIIKAIIETRKEQVCSFMEPQKDKYSQGFVIRPKNAKKTDSGIKLSKEQESRVAELTEFVMNCGDNSNAWHGDNINSFTRKFIHDSLTLDQGVWENVRNRAGELCEFIAVDGATFRIADTHNDEYTGGNTNLKKGEKNGYLPYYVQVHQGRIIAEFYPWELCFGIRNPSSNIMVNGYGKSELEDLIETVTAMLNADMYNANYFKVGSNPKGILRVNGNVNQGRIEEFKNQWQATMAGTRNCIHPDTLIWTKEFGGQEIENIARGKEEQDVTIWTGVKWEKAKIFKTEEKQISVTKVNGGLEIKTSPEHRFAIINDEGDFDWKEQKDLKLGDHVLINKESYSSEYLLTYKDQLIKEDLIEILGWMIGDGTLQFKEWDRLERVKKGSILLFFHYDKELDILTKYKDVLQSYNLNVEEVTTTRTPEQIEKAKRKYKFKTVASKHFGLRICDKDFVRFLIEKLGFQTSADGKIVPESIFNMSESFRCAFLRGLFSADGNREGQCGARLTIRNDELRKQVRNLLLSLGIRTASCEQAKTGKYFDKIICTPKFLTIKDNKLFADKIGFIQVHKQPIKEIVESKSYIPRSVIVKYCKLAHQKHKEEKIFSEAEMGNLRNIISYDESCTYNRLINLLSKAKVVYPSFWDNYYFEKVVSLTQTDEKIFMYDVEVFDDIHAFVADGVIVHNSHKMMIIEADKMDFINTQASNKDMEYSKYQEFLIKIACAIYKIDPSEIGFPMQGASEGNKGLGGEGGIEAKLEYSRDKGLKPLIKQYQSWLNKYVISQKDPNYEIVLEGLDAEDSITELDNDVKAVTNWSTVNEIRRKRGMKDIEGGDIILNPVFLQAQMATMQNQQQEESNQYMDQGEQTEEDQKNNPFLKSLQTDIERLFTEESIAV